MLFYRCQALLESLAQLRKTQLFEMQLRQLVQSDEQLVECLILKGFVPLIGVLDNFVQVETVSDREGFL